MNVTRIAGAHAAGLHWFTVVLTIAFGVLFSSAGATRQAAPSDLAKGPLYTPIWQPVPCIHQMEAGSTTYCGNLIVPRDRANPTGPTLSVYHTIFPAVDGSTNNIPVMYLNGGPGATNADAIAVFESSMSIFREKFGENRDIIVIDQRGTNNSEPTLYCGQELEPQRELVYGLTFREAADIRVQQMALCRQRLVGEGIDLSDFNTYEIAADISDYLEARGLPQVNLYGASYGTRLAMQTMRLFPDDINAVIIDSILPPELNPFIAEVQGTQHGIQALLDAARPDFPDLDFYIDAIRLRLEAEPVVVTAHHYDLSGMPIDNHDVLVTGVKFIGYLADQLRSTPYNEDLPLEIETMFVTGNYQPIADGWLGDVDFSFPCVETDPGCFPAAVGMFQSVFGANDCGRATPQDVFDNIDARVVNNDSLAEWLANSFVWQEPCMVGEWEVDLLPASAATPVVSDLQTLMLVGSLDVATPTIFSRPAEPFLSNHVYYVINAGHATAFLPCVLDMVEDWLNDPGVPPPYGCPTDYTWTQSNIAVALNARPIPTLSPAGMLSLVLIMGFAAAMALRWRRQSG